MDRRPTRARRLGQNFLVDPAAISRILRTVDARETDALLEIGPGRGALTAGLLESVRRMAAVEVDSRLCRELRQRFGSRLVLFEESVLRLDLGRALQALERSGRELLLVGNLPYSISKPLAIRIIEQRAVVRRAVLMFQREVARRLTAKPGSRDYGPLTVLVSQTFDVRPVLDLPPAAFRPRPQVDSTVTQWLPRKDGGLDEAAQAGLRRCLAACFARRRRTLRNNLAATLRSTGRADDLLSAASIDGALRAEALPPAAFRRLAELWPDT